MADAIIDEIRKTRDDYAQQFGYDLHKMCTDLRREQQLSGGGVVSFPKRLVRTTAAGTPSTSTEPPSELTAR
jgi:hypothetical protein